MRPSDNVIIIPGKYRITSSYTTIFSLEGFIEIQNIYNIFQGYKIDEFLNTIRSSARLSEEVITRMEPIYLDLLNELSRINLKWENIPVQPTVTNYVIELKAPQGAPRVLVTQFETTTPFEFYPLINIT